MIFLNHRWHGVTLCLLLGVFFLAPTTSFSFPKKTHRFLSSSPLWGRPKKGLGSIVNKDEIYSVTDASNRRKMEKRSVPGRKKNTSSKQSQGGNISPDLAKFFQDDASANNLQNASMSAEAKIGVADFYEVFEDDKKSSSRRAKQSVRKAAEEAKEQEIQMTIEELEEVIGQEKRTIEEILSPVRKLLAMPTGNFRQLTAGASRKDFRLAWVGSDDAVCYIGTGLHKVPLARLQEVFLSLPGRNRVELNEVIRILGPFPNIRNILTGTSTIEKFGDESATVWNIEYDSMIDGTGKEILAGTGENIRKVSFEVLFCAPTVIVLAVPSTNGSEQDPLVDNGKNILLFVREDALETKFDELRVSAIQ